MGEHRFKEIRERPPEKSTGWCRSIRSATIAKASSSGVPSDSSCTTRAISLLVGSEADSTTTDSEPTFQSLTDRACACIPGNRPFPTALDPFTCNRYECAEYAREVLDIGVRYIGLCCGAAPHHIRAVAEALGRTVPASRYSPDMSKHAFFGTDAAIPDKYKERKIDI